MKNRIATLALLLLAACSQQTSSTQSTPAPTPTNPLDFPIYSGSAILATRDWKETVSAQAAGGQANIFSQGAGTYSGHEVIAQSPASAEQLQSWLHDQGKTPPTGYSVAASGSALDEVHQHARSIGVDFEVFDRNVGGKHRGLIVMVVDPQELDKHAKTELSVISTYKMLPQSARDAVDAQVRKNTGFTVGEFISPNSPIGAALNSLDDFRKSGDRGIIILDAQKQ